MVEPSKIISLSKILRRRMINSYSVLDTIIFPNKILRNWGLGHMVRTLSRP